MIFTIQTDFCFIRCGFDSLLLVVGLEFDIAGPSLYTKELKGQALH